MVGQHPAWPRRRPRLPLGFGRNPQWGDRQMVTTTTQPKPARVAAAEHPAQAYLDTIAKAELSWLAPVQGFGTAVIDAWADLIEESAAFYARRIRQDVRTLHAVLHCRTPAELQAIQSDFVQKAIDEYQIAGSRMMVMMEKAAAVPVAGEAGTAKAA
jgi:Phasin protein